MTKIKVGSDCSGVGAFIQALQRLNISFTEDFACDFDYYARLTYIHNYGTAEDIVLSNTPEHKYFADKVKAIALKSTELNVFEQEILLQANEFAKRFSFYYPFNMYQREIPKDNLDIYVGTYPCQSFSLAGKRKGQEDRRGILFYQGHEVIKKNLPRFFIIENVKGLLSDDSGKTFQRWIDMLAGKTVNGNPVIFPHEESVPYHVYYQVLNAKHYGVPQNRERIFIIGIRDDADNNFSFPKPYPLVKRLKDVLEPEVDEKYFLSDKMIEGLTAKNHQDNGFTFQPKTEIDTGNCVTARCFKMGADDNYIQVKSATSQGYEIATENDSINFSVPNSETRRGRVGKGVAQTLDTACNQAVMVNGINKVGQLPGHESTGRIYGTNGISPTITAKQGGGHEPYIETNMNNQRIRRLTPRECARLMDFPDTFTWPVSDSQAYKQAGNSIVVNCLVEIIKKLNL